MPTTVLRDTFTGTTGATIAGTVPSPTPLGSTAYTDFTPSFGANVFAAGGGCKASSFGTGGTEAFSSIDLGATSQDSTILASFTAAVGTTPDVLFQWHRDSAGTNYLDATVSFTGLVLILNKTISGTSTELGRPTVTLTAGHNYTLSVANAGGAVTIDLIDNTATTTQHVFTNQAVPTGTGNRVLFGQGAATPGDLKWTELKVTVAGASLTAGTCSTGSVAATTAAVAIATNTGGTAPYSNQLQVSPHTAGTWTNNGSPVTGATASLTATGLSPSTPYDLRVVVTDAASDSATSNAVTESTDAASATAFTLTGPSSGYAGTASGNFTVTPNGTESGTFTPNAVSGVTFNPTSLTWSGDGSAKTFTISRAAAGTVSVNGTFSNGLAPPSSVTYTFNPITLTLSPTTANAAYGGAAIPVTATLAGSTAVLAASISPSLGTLSTSAPTSGTPFTYTPPGTGTSAVPVTVTVADATDGLTRTCVVTCSPLAGQIVVYHPVASLDSVYFVVLGHGGKAWNGTAFEPLEAARWGAYAIAGSDPAGVGLYFADFPSSVPAGTVTVFGYARAGGSPAATDALIAAETGSWDGSDFAEPSSGSSSGGPASPTCTVAAGSTGAAVVVSGLPASRNYVGQRLYHFASAEARTIASQSFAGGNYTFGFTGTAGTEGGPFSAATTGDAVLPVP